MWNISPKRSMVCLCVILLCYRIICLWFRNERFCNKKGALFVPDPVYFDYAITVVSIYPPLPFSTQQHPLPQAILSPLFVSMGHVYKFFGYSISYTVLYALWLFCNYLFVLPNYLTSSSIAMRQLSKCSPYPWFWLCSSCFLSLFFRFNCWQLCIYCYLIVHSFDLLFS